MNKLRNSSFLWSLFAFITEIERFKKKFLDIKFVSFKGRYTGMGKINSQFAIQSGGPIFENVCIRGMLPFAPLRSRGIVISQKFILLGDLDNRSERNILTHNNQKSYGSSSVSFAHHGIMNELKMGLNWNALKCMIMTRWLLFAWFLDFSRYATENSTRKSTVLCKNILNPEKISWEYLF